MANGSRTGQAHEWRVHSVVVRVRDGPDRVRAVYRLLLDRKSLSANGLSLFAVICQGEVDSVHQN